MLVAWSHPKHVTLHESCNSSHHKICCCFFNMQKQQQKNMETMLQTIFIVTLSLQAHLTAEVPSVTLMNAAKPGLKMPVAGIGTWGYVHVPGTGIPGEVWNDTVAEKVIKEWLALGGRRIDGSLGYLDQVGVGNAVKASGIPREEIFMTSKVSLAGYNETFTQMDQILGDLQMNYVDLLLIHFPKVEPINTDPACKEDLPSWRGCRQSVWKALEKLFNDGKALAIGVSNFEQKHLEDIIMMNSTVPSVNQVEYRPYWHEDDLVQYCKSNNIVFNSYAPLGTPDWAPTRHHWNGTILELSLIQSIAKAHDCTAAQVLQRWEWQQGIVVNPRTLNSDHMKENLNFFDFELSDTEMKQISTLKPPPDPKVCPYFNDVK